MIVFWFFYSVAMYFLKFWTKFELNILGHTWITNSPKHTSQIWLCNQTGHVHMKKIQSTFFWTPSTTNINANLAQKSVTNLWKVFLKSAYAKHFILLLGFTLRERGNQLNDPCMMTVKATSLSIWSCLYYHDINIAECDTCRFL